MNEEWVDIIDNEGNFTGKSCSKTEAHKKGYFHPTIHVWFYTTENELLFQLRSPNKINYPNLWDVSVAGHIISGETSINAAIREVKEELGIHLSEDHLQYIGSHKTSVTHKDNYIDNEFNYIFLSPLKQDINSLILQQEEVVGVKLFPIEQLKQLKNEFVPYSKEYFDTLLTELRKVIS
ncbi:NUDIX hydrolase [Pseudofulvibacter geojedonensis]|uniref:NUDIX domain-containing protein n=1 Tax=Pseudofulvibacter geojedonensis TaxID=1123758 RepID=A0ABW3HZ30_9FLAO